MYISLPSITDTSFSVNPILAFSNPSQITDVIVVFVAIDMVYINLSLYEWNKCLRNKTMNVVDFFNTLITQPNDFVFTSVFQHE